MTYSVIVASNSETVLRSCLLASPDLNNQVEISIQRDPDSAALAYNRGVRSTLADVMIFAHQDVYLPAGWLRNLELALDRIRSLDPNWGVLGLLGVNSQGQPLGHLYSTGLGKVLGANFKIPAPVETLDEVVLILRRSAGLWFDEGLPGFHLYGTDICLQARALGLESYAISAFAIHNSNGIKMLPLAYWKCWLRLRRKWSSRLPIVTPCMPITRWGGVALRYLIWRAAWLARSPYSVGRRVANPASIWEQLQEKSGERLLEIQP
jgi:hypothetical protein